jgi:hypothetical protein
MVSIIAGGDPRNTDYSVPEYSVLANTDDICMRNNDKDKRVSHTILKAMMSCTAIAFLVNSFIIRRPKVYFWTINNVTKNC